MKMLTEEQCAKLCPKNMLSWDVGVLGRNRLFSLQSAESSLVQGFPSSLLTLGL